MPNSYNDAKGLSKVFSIITLIFFGRLYKLEYATDTYQVFNFDSEGIFTQFAMSGRYITAIVGKLVKELNISNEFIYISSYVLAIIFIISSQYKIYKIVKDDISNKVLQILVPILIIINPFSIELFLFIEKGIMIFGILMSIYAVEYFIKYLKEKKKRNILYSAICMFVANCSYQGVVGIFVAMALVYIVKYSKNIKQFIVNNVIAMLIYGVPAIADYFIVKILYSSSRVNGEIIILESIKKIYDNTLEMIKNTYYILPKNFFLLIIIITLLLIYYKIFTEKKYLGLLEVSYIIIGVIISAVIPQLMQSTSSIWFVPRSTYVFASLYGILLLYLILRFKVDKRMIFVISLLSVALLSVQLQKFVKIEKDRYIINKEDYEISIAIKEKVEDYEQTTGNTIKKLAIYTDSSPRYTYDGIFASGDMNIKAYMAEWSTKSILEYYLNRELKQIPKDEKIEKDFLEKNWDEFSGEQIFFYNDVFVLCNY